MSGLLIDCFAGGGGASKGIELALNRPIDIAVNHDPEAIRIHKVNHPHTLHLTEDIFTVDLQKYAAAHPQMREVAIPLLRRMQELVPVVFDDLEVPNEKS